MDFVTKLDFSTRQVKQQERTFAIISGGTTFGVTFSALTKGPDLTTSGVSMTVNGVVSTFSGNSATTVYNWYDSNMNIALYTLSAWTPSNSAITQDTGLVFTSSTTTTIDDNLVTLVYTGVSFDLTPILLVDLGSGNYSGSVYSDVLDFISAGTLDYTGRTIWNDVNGITRTERLIITNVGAGPGVTDIGIDANGFVVDQASDISLKENINTITNPLQKVLGLRGVTYNWKDRDKGGNSLKIGLIAQEVQGVVPELTYYGTGGYMGVHYKDIPALLVEAIKELVNSVRVPNVTIDNVTLNTQTIIAEDNNIELNYNGNHKTAIGGGITILKGINESLDAKFLINNQGNFEINTGLLTKSLVIPKYTPESSNDIYGTIGELTRDDDFLYLKVNEHKWKRIKLEDF